MNDKRISQCAIVLAGVLSLACKSNPPAPSVSEAWQRSDPPPSGSAAPSNPGADHAINNSSHAANPAGHAPGGAGGGPPVASVNGRVITREWLARELIAAHGLNLLVQKIALEVVRQEADKAHIVVAEPDIEHEYDLTLRLSAGSEADKNALTPQRRAQLIEQWRLSRGVSVEELRMAMQRQAVLRKLASARLTVNEQMLRDEFARIYGTKVECRHIVVASLREADKLRPHIDAGDEFATLARRNSLNDVTAPNGGLLPPFTRNDETIPALLREAAFRMEPGQVSNPIQINGQIHLLKLERRIAPTIMTFESVRDSVESALRERLTPVEMERLLASLQKQALLKIDDPVVRKQYEEAVKAGRITGPALGS